MDKDKIRTGIQNEDPAEVEDDDMVMEDEGAVGRKIGSSSIHGHSRKEEIKRKS